MLHAFALTQALHESAGFSADNIEPHEFIGSIIESANEANYMIMSEAVAVSQFNVASDEIMVEAFISNPASIGAISENIFTTIGANIKKFFDKIIAAVKGLILKFKAYFARVRTNTSKWLSLMKDKVKAAAGLSGFGNETYEGYDWKLDYLKDTIKKISSVPDQFDETTGAKNIKDVKDMFRGDFVIGEDNSSQITEVEQENERLKHVTEEEKEAAVTKIAEKLSVANENPVTMEDVWNAVDKTVKGGQLDRNTFKIGSAQKAEDMLKYLDEYHKDKETIIKILGDALKAYETGKNEAMKALGDGSADKLTKDITDYDKFPADVKAVFSERVRVVAADVTTKYSIYSSAINTASAKIGSYFDEIARDYMRILTKLSNYKVKKS